MKTQFEKLGVPESFEIGTKYHIMYDPNLHSFYLVLVQANSKLVGTWSNGQFQILTPATYTSWKACSGLEFIREVCSDDTLHVYMRFYEIVNIHTQRI